MENLIAAVLNALPPEVTPEPPCGGMVVIDEADPLAFWSRFTGALQHREPVAILEPGWPVDWKQHYRQIACEMSTNLADREILIPTSGTSGMPRFCRHTLQTLSAAARSFRDLFQPDGCLNAINVLPANHVGGLMPVLRTALCGGRVQFADYRQLELSRLGFSPAQASISLVPTQLSRMMDSPPGLEFLKGMGLILVGGASCPNPLLETGRRHGLRLSPCYGSSETAAMVTVLHPEQFLAGESGVGQPMPGVKVTFGRDQHIAIHSESIQLGYIPALQDFSRDPFLTSDIGQIDGSGNLHIMGRADRIIITGGKKVIPEQVESACWDSGMVADVKCAGEPDPEWGSRVILDAVFNDSPEAGEPALKSFLRERLPAYAVPKSIRSIEAIDRTPMGKVNYRI